MNFTFYFPNRILFEEWKIFIQYFNKVCLFLLRYTFVQKIKQVTDMRRANLTFFSIIPTLLYFLYLQASK